MAPVFNADVTRLTPQADRTMGKAAGGTALARVKCDITDLSLAGVPFLQARDATEGPRQCGGTGQGLMSAALLAASSHLAQGAGPVGLVLIAKHLCGAGTDVALRCALQCNSPGVEEPAAASMAVSAAASASGEAGPAVGSGDAEETDAARHTTRMELLPPPQLRLLGVAVAPCCHHRCTYGAYVNPAFLHRHGVCGRGWPRSRLPRNPSSALAPDPLN